MPKTSRLEDPAYKAICARLGSRVRQARNEAGLTQEELVRQLGWPHPDSKSWISDLEIGRHSADVHSVQRIADVLGYPIAFFTDPKYDARKPQWPRTPAEWRLLAAGDNERADAHAALDSDLDQQRRESA